MSGEKINLFILDDNIPKIPEFIERGVFEKGVEKDDLLYLAENYDWAGENSLKHLILNLINHDYVKTGQIEIYGFLHPEICLGAIEDNLQPNVVIYDWEYGNSLSDSSSGGWLLEILEKTKAFIFVYSSFRDYIPPTLNKKEFDAFAKRFQLFSKGNITNSVFSSEDFLYQYILTLVNKDNIIKIQGEDVKFESSGYLEKPTDILYLESILGYEALMTEIHKAGNTISEVSVEKIVSNSTDELYLDRERGFLISSNSQLLLDKFKPTEKISFLEALKTFGLSKCKEVIETGFTKV